MTAGRPRRVPLTACPACQGTLSGAMGTNVDAAPSPGDPTVCGHCGALLVFTEGLGLRQVTDAERAELMADPDVERAVGVVLTLLATGNGPRRR